MWKDIPGYEGHYQASHDGRIKSVARIVPHARHGSMILKERILRTPPDDRYGYFRVCLSKNGVQSNRLVHQLVAATWIGPVPDGQEVCHGSNGVVDNSVSNLSYGTRLKNQRDRYRDGTYNGKRVRRGDGIEFISTREAAEKSNCHHANISYVCNGKRKTAGGYGWSYVEEK